MRSTPAVLRAATIAGAIALVIVAARLAGFSAYVVMSGSMEPAIATGSVILVEAVPPDTVRVGDIITFALPDRVVTHRVAAISTTDGALAFTTRGDANAVADSGLVRPAGHVGSLRASVPLLGFAVSEIQRWWRPVALALLLWLVLDALVARVHVRGRPGRAAQPVGP